MFNFFFSFSTYPLIAKLALFISYPLTYVLPVVIVVFLLVRKKEKMFTFSLLFLSGFFSWIAARMLKDFFQISRPYVTHNLIPLVNEPGYSFPSEHVTVFAALSVATFFLHKKSGILLAIATLCIALSRIVIGAHYPIDVLGGAVLGSLVGLLLIKVFKYI